LLEDLGVNFRWNTAAPAGEAPDPQFPHALQTA
jgi:hypothetical protein